MWVVLVIIYIAVIWILSVFFTVEDKSRARRGLYRIRESTLLWLAALGGAFPMLCTMRVIHHKTRKAKFMITLPLLIALHLFLAVLVMRKWMMG